MFFNPTEGISTLLTAMQNAINGYTSLGSVDAGIRGIDASHVPSIAGLNGKTFQIRDDGRCTRIFEFVDLAGSTTLTAGDVAVYFNSTASGINMATIRTAMLTAINGADFSCTAQAMPDGSIAPVRQQPPAQPDVHAFPVEERAGQPERHDLPDHRFLEQDCHLRVY